MEHNLLQEVLVLLTVSVIVIALFRRLQIPSIISYLFVGIIIGPYALAWIDDRNTTRLLGEIGVVFLLFTIGLDFSIKQLHTMKKTLLGLGGAQVFIGVISGGVIAMFFGIPWQGALIVGGALALSSTAIVIKQLTDQMELHSEHGRLAFSILLFQDLAAVPFLALIPILAQGESLGWPILEAILKGILALVFILIFGRWALRPIFHEVAASRSAELFTLTVLLISLAAAWITHKLGLSLALGAFLAGMMLSETEYRHQIEVEIRPFRDVLLGLFFITVGMQLDLTLFHGIWAWTLLLLAGVVLGKGFVIYLLLKMASYNNSCALRTGQIMAQGGEFGIALLFLAVISGLITVQDSQPILAAVILSMAIAPILVKHNNFLVNFLSSKKYIQSEDTRPNQISNAVNDLNNHVVICGFGRVGKNIAESLLAHDIKFIGLDINPENIKSGWLEDEPVFFGDATNIKILEAARLDQAFALVICVNNMEDAFKILDVARKLSMDIPIFVRAHDDALIDNFFDANADEVISETREVGEMITTKLLLLFDKSPNEIYKHIKKTHGKRSDFLYIFINKDPDI